MAHHHAAEDAAANPEVTDDSIGSDRATALGATALFSGSAGRAADTAVLPTAGRVTGLTAPAGEPDPGQDGALPVWFEWLAIVALSVVLSFGSIGLLLAFFGHFSVGTVFPAAVVTSVVLVLLALVSTPRLRSVAQSGRSSRSTRWPALGMVAVALASIGVNGILDGHYVRVDRDPGVYAVTAKWLATHGGLEVQAGLTWATKSPDVTWATGGVYPESNGRMEFQFAHFVPVLMAEGQKIGGDRLMFAVPALLGALGLCLVYAVGCRLIRRPWLVLAAVAALAISLPEAMVSRDSYSETATQLLLLGAIWAMLRAYETALLDRPRRAAAWCSALFAGLVLGAAMTSRIDALVYLIPVPVVLAVGWLAAPGGPPRRRLGTGIAVLIIAAIPGTLLGTADVTYRAGGYYDALRSNVNLLRYAVVASTVVAVLLLALWPRLAGRPIWAGLRRRSLVLAPVAVIVGLIGLWSIRPGLEHPDGLTNATTALLQAQEHLPVDPLRSYGEQSLNWFSWYYGPLTIALAVLGVAMMATNSIRRASPAALLLLAMTGFGALLYLWAPNITPEQLWATRRYVPAGLPLLVLASAVGIESLTEVLRAGVAARWVSRTFPVIAAVAVVAATGAATWPIKGFQTQAGFITVVDKTCAEIGPHSAVLFTATDPYGSTLVQTMRSFCNVPAATAGASMTPEKLQQLAGKFRAEGSRLWVLGSTDQLVHTLVPATTAANEIGSVASTREFEKTLSRPPSQYVTATLTLWGAGVDGPA